MNAPPDIDAILMRLATELAVSEGDFTALMTRTQRKAYRALTKRQARLFVLDCSRRWGKTVFCVFLMFVTALGGPDRIVRYIAPTKLHGRQFVIPTVRWLSKQLPEHMRPRFNTQDNTWIWPNGSVCHLGSAETMGDVEAMVGTECHRALIDEAGKIRSDLLQHLHRSVLRAQLLTTHGDIVVASTPAVTPDHYLRDLVTMAAEDDALARYTIDDCDHVKREEIDDMVRELGGRMSTEVRRELYCEHIAERTRLVVPEFQDVEHEIVIARDLPEWRDWYVSADLGFEDLSVALFAFYDFQRAKIVVWDEHSARYASGLEFGFAVKAKEAEWSITEPRRYADGTPQLLADLADTKYGPGLSFGLPAKDDSEAALNQCRMRIQQKQVEIHPRCKVLIEHLRNAIWNTNRTTFERSEKHGHYDAVDALKYLVRVVDWRKNPTPAILPGVFRHTHIIPTDQRDAMRRASDVLRGLR